MKNMVFTDEENKLDDPKLKQLKNVFSDFDYLIDTVDYFDAIFGYNFQFNTLFFVLNLSPRRWK